MNDGNGLVVDVQARFADEGASRSPFLTFGLSWYAYLTLVKTLLLRVVVFSMLGFLLRYPLIWLTGKDAKWLVLAFFIVAIVSIIYDYLYLNSMRLYTDENGVWLQRGVFPWEKGVSGVKWRDVSEASYMPNFMSWALKCHSVRVGHRFTNDSEILVKHIRHGDLAVQHINQIAMGIAGRM